MYDVIESRLAKIRLSKRGAVHLLGTSRCALMFAVLLVATLLCSQPVRGAIITFEAGNESAQPASPVTLAIRVADFTDVFGFSFSLQWDPGVVQFDSIASFAALPGFTAGNFNTDETGSGRLGVLWDDSDFSGNDLANGSLLFDINFTAVGAGGTSTTVVFGDTPTARDVVVIDSGNPTQATFAGVNGNLSVVPEPVNIALGLFATICFGVLTVRRISRWRKPAGS